MIILKLLVAGGLFLAIDAIWLGLVANKLYKRELNGLLAKKPNFVAAAIFYLLYVCGIIIFALEPALDDGSAGSALGHGALLGLLMYATYDLTNLSTLKNWPVKLSIIDMAWGSFVTGLVALLTYLIFI